MSDIDLARSHVERCLQDLWDVHHVQTDDDGDYPYRRGTAACWISLDEHDPPIVKAIACAAVGVKKSAKLLGELNEINSRCRTSHVYWSGGSVIVEQSMLAHAVDRRALAHAGQSVASVANDIGTMIATMFGGQTPLQELEDAAE
ncbi:hypothetical protein A5746_21695 [Mycolicibacterium conceptionense]|uniref:T3SS (YopN, CesT) and YbjN peptide-binding chaperone 1 n=1 Tax=Mycobacteriaceae TaxID=1762 RepID=UPI00096FBE94|nr:MULTISPECIES: YbjN domain-containing protein [Mycobacteriaceae]OMB89903.1 hypothetical protein A5746_21695 [Mycolicibacterium conceptionense]SKK26907.1 Uncharacterised protein [Mycobacteroides abscessus subsp. massiliense]